MSNNNIGVGKEILDKYSSRKAKKCKEINNTLHFIKI